MFASVVRGITLCHWISAGDVPTTFTNQPPIEFTKSLRLEIRSPGSRPQPPNMTHWQYQHPSICRSNRTTLADECTQGFPLCCRIRPDIAVFCIDRTATCPRGSTELALDTPPVPAIFRRVPFLSSPRLVPITIRQFSCPSRSPASPDRAEPGPAPR